MEIIKLRRFVPENTIATYGILLYNNFPFAVTLELPWKNNNVDISCIPCGEYETERYSSEKYNNVWKIKNVKDRDLILIHWGNFLKDFKGCIGVGEKFTDIDHDGIADIGESKSVYNEGFNELMVLTKDWDRFKLVIEKAESWSS